MGSVVTVDRIRKTYGEVVAVDAVSFVVERGAIFGIVGPNGAGKTTTVECIEGLRIPDAGQIEVLGVNPATDRKLFERVGVQLQESSLYARIRVGEAMKLFASFYDRPANTRELLRQFGLEGKESAYYGTLSGGQKRRVLVALALVGLPELAILDEPTSGLDPQARYNMWASLQAHRDRGCSILMTTHYLEEAQEHCDVVAVIDQGRVVAMGSPKDLLRTYRLGTRITSPVVPGEVHQAIGQVPGVTRVETVDSRLLIYGEGQDLFSAVAGVLAEYGVGTQQLEVRPVTLEDLYLLLTGRAYREV